MPHYPTVVDREHDVWCVWSTVVDAAIKVGGEEDIKAHFRQEPGQGLYDGKWHGWLDQETQTEWREDGESVYDIRDFAGFNRAGVNESRMSLDGLIHMLSDLRQEHGCTSL